MVKKKYIVLVIYLFISTFIVFGINSNIGDYYQIEEYKFNFNKDNILKTYESISNSKENKSENDYFILAASASSLSYVVDGIQNMRGEEGMAYAREAIEWAEEGLKRFSYPAEIRVELYYILTDMYSRLITGASSGMRYNSTRLEYLDKCLSESPDHIGANVIKALNLIHTPKAFGGNPAKGEEILFSLSEKYPENPYVLMGLVKYYMHHKDLSNAKTRLLKLISLRPEHILAKNTLKEIEWEESSFIISDITVNGKIKTRLSLVKQKTKEFIGKTYSTDMKSKIINAVTQIHSISGCNVKPEVDQDTLTLNLYISESNMLILNPIIGVSLSFDYDKEVNFFNEEAFSFPVFSLTFVDTNLFGLSDEFIFECAGPHLHTEWIHYWLIDTKLYIETLFVNETFMSYDDGHWLSDITIKSPFYIFDIGLGKTFPFNLSVYLHNILKINNWISAEDYSSPDLIVPEDSLTYSTKLHVLFDNVGIQDNLWILDGFKVEWYPELIWKVDYAEWGMPGNLFEHDNIPEFRFNIMAGYYKKLFQDHNFRCETQFFTGYNFYEREKWVTGKDILSNPFDLGLSGFYFKEFRFQTGWLFNIYYSIPVIPSVLRFYVKNDTFIDFDTLKVYDGAGIGSMMRFPFNIELTLQLGLGLNAPREEIPGIEFDASLTKIFSF